MDEAKPCDARHPSGARCALQAGHEGNHRPRDEHHCHARGCMVATKPEMLMCRRHWFMVPPHLRARVWATYRAGQCDDKRPSPEWHAAADAAIDAVATAENAVRFIANVDGAAGPFLDAHEAARLRPACICPFPRLSCPHCQHRDRCQACFEATEQPSEKG